MELDSGIQYFVNVDGEINSITYIPANRDNKLRCKGFPKYHPIGEIYRPLDIFVIKGNDYESDKIDRFLYHSREYPNDIGYIFVYLKTKSPIAQSMNLINKIKDFVYKNRKESPKKVKIIFGGYRDSSQIETFLFPRNYLSPVATPKYPSS